MSEVKLQEQIELTTPNGHKVTIRGYATGKIRQAISAAYLKDTQIELTGERDEKGQAISRTITSGMGSQYATNAAIEAMVLSLDGTGSNILERVLELPEEDYDFIRTEVGKATDPLAKKPSTGSPKPSTTS